jgi:hypothetical protein
MSSRPKVHIAMGRALEKAQWLETEVGTVLLAVDALETRSFLKPEEDAYLRLRDAIDHQTLGRSLKKMQEFLKFEQNPESLFARALEARNFLVHQVSTCSTRRNMRILWRTLSVWSPKWTTHTKSLNTSPSD